MRSDSDIQALIETELKWCPELDERDVAVKVNGGIVTLSGYVRRIPEKYRAEAVIKRLAGVVAVANDIEVRPPPGQAVTDPEIALRMRLCTCRTVESPRRMPP